MNYGKVLVKQSKWDEADVFILGIYDSDKKRLNYGVVFENGEAKVINPIDIEEASSLGGYCIKNKESIYIKSADD